MDEEGSFQEPGTLSRLVVATHPFSHRTRRCYRHLFPLSPNLLH